MGLRSYSRKMIVHPMKMSTRPSVSMFYSNETSNRDIYFMKLAIRHAQFAFREKEVPIGAVIVDENGQVLSTARNRVETMKDCTCHAEIEAIRKASKIRNNWRLLGCSIYTTLEPCAMCMGAIQSSRISRVVYSAKDHRLGVCGSWIDIVNGDYIHPFHQVKVDGGILEEESSILLKRFFQSRRRESPHSTLDSTYLDRGHDFSLVRMNEKENIHGMES